MIENLIFGLHLYSAHANHEPWVNNSNQGIYLRYDDFQIGTYKNTLSKQTNYLAYQLLPKISLKQTEFELFIGIASGYSRQTKSWRSNEHAFSESEPYSSYQMHYQEVGFSHKYNLFFAPSIQFPVYKNWKGRVFLMKNMLHLSTEWEF